LDPGHQNKYNVCTETLHLCCSAVVTGSSDGGYWRPTWLWPPNIFVIKPLSLFFSSTPATLPFLARSPGSRERGSSSYNDEVSEGVGHGSALAVAAEVQNIKMTDDSATYLLTLRPTRERHDPGVRQPLDANGSILGFGSMLGGSSIPA
jgi:hypothetical protein